MAQVGRVWRALLRISSDNFHHPSLSPFLRFTFKHVQWQQRRDQVRSSYGRDSASADSCILDHQSRSSRSNAVPAVNSSTWKSSNWPGTEPEGRCHRRRLSWNNCRCTTSCQSSWYQIENLWEKFGCGKLIARKRKRNSKAAVDRFV